MATAACEVSGEIALLSSYAHCDKTINFVHFLFKIGFTCNPTPLVIFQKCKIAVCFIMVVLFGSHLNFWEFKNTDRTRA